MNNKKYRIIRLCPSDLDKIKARLKYLTALYPKTSCFIWNGYTNKPGYGLFQVNKKVVLAHRASYFCEFPEFDQDLFVLHKCDNPSCVNVSHLFLGTHKENCSDKVYKGRQAKGQQIGCTALTDEEVVNIRKIYYDTKPFLKDLSKQLNIHKETLRSLLCGKTWKYLPNIDYAGTKHGYGSKHYNSSLTEKEVLEIRELKNTGQTTLSLSKRYGVSKSAIKHILQRRSWKHI